PGGPEPGGTGPCGPDRDPPGAPGRVHQMVSPGGTIFWLRCGIGPVPAVLSGADSGGGVGRLTPPAGIPPEGPPEAAAYPAAAAAGDAGTAGPPGALAGPGAPAGPEAAREDDPEAAREDDPEAAREDGPDEPGVPVGACGQGREGTAAAPVDGCSHQR